MNDNLIKILVSTDCNNENKHSIKIIHKVQEKLEIKQEKKLNKENNKLK